MIRALSCLDIDKVVELETTELNTTLGSDMLKSYIDNSMLYAYVYELNKEIIGYISCNFDGEVLEILNFCVSSIFQKKGIGTELLAFVLNHFYALGATSSILEVRESNVAAITLYEKFGYKVIHIRKGYYSNNEDALIMQKGFISYLELEKEYLAMFAKTEEHNNYIKVYDSIQPDKYYHNFYELKNDDDLLLSELINKNEGIICFKSNNPIKYKFQNRENNIYMHSCIRGIKSLKGSVGVVKELTDNNSEEVEEFLYNDGLEYGEGYAKSNAKRLVELRNYKNMKAFVIYEDKKVIGYVHTFIYHDFAKIEDFFILDEYQRKGYGSTLFINAVNYLKNNGVNDICLVADNEDTPKQMYEKMGFVKVGEYFFYRK